LQRHGDTGKSIDGEITEPAAVGRSSGSKPIAEGRRAHNAMAESFFATLKEELFYRRA
jgi:hypothetical protein